jgi:hypothetical protein
MVSLAMTIKGGSDGHGAAWMRFQVETSPTQAALGDDSGIAQVEKEEERCGTNPPFARWHWWRRCG